MRTILHILTQAANPLAEEIIARQQALPETAVEIVRLTDEAANGTPDYERLVEQIFTADSVEVW